MRNFESKYVCVFVCVVFIISGCVTYTQEQIQAMQMQAGTYQGPCSLSFESSNIKLDYKFIPVDSNFMGWSKETGFVNGIMVDGVLYNDSKDENEIFTRSGLNKYIVKNWSVSDYRDISNESGLPKSVEEKIKKISSSKNYKNINLELTDYQDNTGDIYQINSLVKAQDPLNIMSPGLMRYSTLLTTKDLNEIIQKKEQGCDILILASAIQRAYSIGLKSIKIDDLHDRAATHSGLEAHFKFIAIESQNILKKGLQIKQEKLLRAIKSAKERREIKQRIALSGGNSSLLKGIFYTWAGITVLANVLVAGIQKGVEKGLIAPIDTSTGFQSGCSGSLSIRADNGDFLFTTATKFKVKLTDSNGFTRTDESGTGFFETGWATCYNMCKGSYKIQLSGWDKSNKHVFSVEGEFDHPGESNVRLDVNVKTGIMRQI